MILNQTKGITLEQNKEPMLSREIKRLAICDDTIQQSTRNRVVNPELLAPHEIVIAAREARIVDETDGKRLWKKMAQAVREGIGSLVVDAIDDEPYLSSQLGPVLAYGDKLVQGIALARRAVGANRVVIETYKNLMDVDIKIPAKIGGVRVDRVSGTYPVEQRAHRQLRRENALVLGACAVLALRDAIYEGMAHTTCFVTVAGDCVANPANYEVPIGCSVAQVLDYAGLVTDPKRVIVGGSMTGFSIDDPSQIAVTPTTRGILAFADEYRDLGYSCIGCGRCTQVCPEGLSPYYIYKVVKSRSRHNLELFDADRCIGCGTCSYVCPAKLDLQQTIVLAARLTRAKGGSR